MAVCRGNCKPLSLCLAHLHFWLPRYSGCQPESALERLLRFESWPSDGGILLMFIARNFLRGFKCDLSTQAWILSRSCCSRACFSPLAKVSWMLLNIDNHPHTWPFDGGKVITETTEDCWVNGPCYWELAAISWGCDGCLSSTTTIFLSLKILYYWSQLYQHSFVALTIWLLCSWMVWCVDWSIAERFW